jgi:thiamine transport system substrate-binding protein
MKHLVSFLFLVTFVVIVNQFYQKKNQQAQSNLPTLNVFASSSFINQWGPGPWLKSEFEKTCQCKVNFFDGADNTLLLQKLKSEGRTEGADIVLSFDQYDIENLTTSFSWKKIDTQSVDFIDEIKSTVNQYPLVPYDWGTLAFVIKKSKVSTLPKKLDDLLNPEFSGQIALQDPRLSSVGLQFYLWLVQIKGKDEAIQYLKKLNKQLHSYSQSWSASYKLFQSDVAKTTFSYTTSPVYHLVEEKSNEVIAVEFEEGHPRQFEYMGIPDLCKNCDLAQSFAALILSPTGQKIIMEKNYMFPVVKNVIENTPFQSIPPYKHINLENKIFSQSERDALLKAWTALRRSE